MRSAFALMAGVIGLSQVNAAVFTLPTLSNNRINLFGDNSANPPQGVAAYFSNASPGHALGPGVVENSPPGTAAYYYLAGIEHTPVAGATDTGQGVSLTGMANTANYFGLNGGNVSQLTLRFGQTGVDETRTWKLGGDVNGVNWFGNPNSSVEERKYEANAAEVNSGLFYNGQQILTFGYTPLYMVIDYGGSVAVNDDTIAAFSDAVGATKLGGLNPFEDGLANSLLSDINANGGLVQLNLFTIQPATREDYAFGNYTAGSFTFDGALQVVPEPSEYALFFGTATLAAGIWLRRRRQTTAAINS
jgi:hypothetical protein